MIYDLAKRGIQLHDDIFISSTATLIGASALVPDGAVVPGSPGKVVRTLDMAGRERLRQSALRSIENGRHYRQGLVAREG